MNEAKTTPRQKKILGVLGSRDSATRTELGHALSTVYLVSKATLARDLKSLLNSNQIKSSGTGRSTTYHLAPTHPLLRPINLSDYFDLEPDQRTQAGKQFDQDIFNQLPGLFTTPEQAELGQISKPLPKKPNRRELERFVVELSWKSSKIEGNTYTLLETESLIKDSQMASGKTTSEATMILNHKAAFESILTDPTAFARLDSSTVLQLHNSLIANLNIPTGIRSHPVGISGTAYLPPDNQWQLTEYFNQTLDYVNIVTFPLEKAVIISAMISYLQPFADGNKRTARMLTNAILIAHNLYPLSYRSVDENEYKQALILFFETHNLYHIKRLIIDQYRFALSTYFL